ncbi:unnamed protein product [Brachionus calyciflorus]|uniref:TLDc domain-containing protein n=1 Tax=Brachionus calyciflorus TaxID=104777 RepID=A0A814IET3_9BILA|nr:unnamed protein product [Brachionus calyciflorus]
MNDINQIIKFDVGGGKFSTYRSTICKKLRKIAPSTDYYRFNLLEETISSPNINLNEEIFFDRNPHYFNFILDFYRLIKIDENGNINSNDFKERLPYEDYELLGIKKEAEFFKVDHLVEIINVELKNEFEDSLILNKNLSKKLNKLCEFPERTDWELIYRASRDGFNSDDFHFKCDNVSRTLTIIQTKDNYIFGGYTEQTWSQNGEMKKDNDAFIFSLVNKEKNPIKIPIKNNTIAICCYKGFGPTFGGGHDISLVSNSNVIPKSYSNLGCSFKHAKYEYFSDQAQNFLAGSFRFLVSEIEVFAKI